jgi:transposase
MEGRYELSDQRWQMIKDIVSPPQIMGRPRHDDRRMLNGILWILFWRSVA